MIHLLILIFISCNEAFSSTSFLLYTAMPGHAVQQENKSALLDLLDALAYPSELYVGTLSDQPSTRESYTPPNERYRSTAVLIPRAYFCSYYIFLILYYKLFFVFQRPFLLVQSSCLLMLANLLIISI